MQYLVVAFDPDQFKDRILPELSALSRKGILRVVDILVVSREADGKVQARELYEVLPGEETRFSYTRPDDAPDWFTMDDIEAAGSALPAGSAVALLLFEHTWAAGLDAAVAEANARELAGYEAGPVVSEIERLLVLGGGSEASVHARIRR